MLLLELEQLCCSPCVASNQRSVEVTLLPFKRPEIKTRCFRTQHIKSMQQSLCLEIEGVENFKGALNTVGV